MMNTRALTFIRRLVFAGLVPWAFLIYGGLRGMGQTLSAGGFFAPAGSAAFMAVFSIIWAAPFAGLAIVLALIEGRVNDRRRRCIENELCLSCEYDCRSLDGRPCPECGTPRADQEPFCPRRPADRSTVLAILVVWFVGCAAAELFLACDEWAFRREAAAIVAAGGTSHYRGHAWPFGSSEMGFDLTRGYWNKD